MARPDSRSRLLEIADRLAGRRVAVIGDFVLDRFVLGVPKRISREAPVLILSHAGEENIPGGGANTAANIRALGGEPLPVGGIGGDSGEILRKILADRGIDVSRLLPVDGFRTPTKTRILGGGPHSIKQQVVRIDREDHVPDGGRVAADLARLVAAASSSADVVVISDYGYGSASPRWVDAVRASAPGAPVLVDSRFRLAEYVGVDAATPNEEELERASGGPLGESDDSFDAAGRGLEARLTCRALLVTRGSRGMALFEPDRPVLRIPVFGTDQVADVTGAGDTVMAAFALALAAGATFPEAARISNYAGGIVVMKMGTATVSREELARAIESDS